MRLISENSEIFNELLFHSVLKAIEIFCRSRDPRSSGIIPALDLQEASCSAIAS